jgi:hypothetical protein
MAEGTGRVLSLRLIPHQAGLLHDTTSDTIVDVAGLGCIAPGTRIYDPIARTWDTVEALFARGEPLNVLALYADGIARPSRATAPFIKGVADRSRSRGGIGS